MADENGDMPEEAPAKGYLRNCLLIPRVLGERMFMEMADHSTYAYLDGYAIIPREKYDDLRTQLEQAQREREAMPLDRWEDEDGSVLWWTFPVCEPPYVGTPYDSGWPGYHTHWTRIAAASLPTPKQGDKSV